MMMTLFVNSSASIDYDNCEYKNYSRTRYNQVQKYLEKSWKRVCKAMNNNQQELTLNPCDNNWYIKFCVERSDHPSENGGCI